MTAELITIEQYCLNCGVESAFIDILEENNLVEIVVLNGTRHIPYHQLPDLENYLRLHYDLNINVEGIDVIKDLLGRMAVMQDQIRELENRLRLHEQLNQ